MFKRKHEKENKGEFMRLPRIHLPAHGGRGIRKFRYSNYRYYNGGGFVRVFFVQAARLYAQKDNPVKVYTIKHKKGAVWI